MRTTKDQRLQHRLALAKINHKNNTAQKFCIDVIDDVNELQHSTLLILSDVRRMLEDFSILKGNIKSDCRPIRVLFGLGLEARMKSLSIKQKELSLAAGVSEKTIGKIIDGRENSRADTLEKLSEAIGATAFDLIERGQFISSGKALPS